MMGDVQPFERHPALAGWIEKIASIGNQFSWATWCAFLREINRALDAERERSRSIHTAGSGLLRALESYGFPVSDAAASADMSVEARNLHNAARRFVVALHSTGSIADALTKAHAAVPRDDLDIILEWYGGLSPGARQKLSLADLHGLSKRLGAPAEVRL